MKHLNFYQPTTEDQLAWPAEPRNLSLDSSALEFFTDFAKVTPLVVDASLSVLEAKALMQKTHVHMLLVVDKAEQFIGVISSEDVIDRHIVQKVSEGFDRANIPVTELMTPKTALQALDFQEVVKASIAEVISALKDSGKQHCLVLDRTTHLIRGIFSANELSRKLHLPIHIPDKSNFYRVFAAVSS